MPPLPTGCEAMAPAGPYAAPLFLSVPVALSDREAIREEHGAQAGQGHVGGDLSPPQIPKGRGLGQAKGPSFTGIEDMAEDFPMSPEDQKTQEAQKKLSGMFAGFTFFLGTEVCVSCLHSDSARGTGFIVFPPDARGYLPQVTVAADNVLKG